MPVQSCCIRTARSKAATIRAPMAARRGCERIVLVFVFSRATLELMSGSHGHHAHAPGHSHAHSHGHLPSRHSFGRSFAIATVLNTVFMIAEVIFGFYANSLALLADAGHNFSDVVGLLLAWGAFAV